jgi:hypothetical protein
MIVEEEKVRTAKRIFSRLFIVCKNRGNQRLVIANEIRFTIPLNITSHYAPKQFRQVLV